MKISLREFARRRKVTLGAVQKAIKSGRVGDDAIERNQLGRVVKIDEDLANAHWAANTDPVEAARNGQFHTPASGSAAAGTVESPAVPAGQGEQLQLEEPGATSAAPGVSAAAGGSQSQYLDARARRENFEAKSAELKYLENVGLLVSASEAREAAFRRYRTLRDKLINIPDRVATILAAERDPVVVHKLLTEELKRVLNELSDGARSAAAGGDSERMAA
jgi:hypothetical protein